MCRKSKSCTLLGDDHSTWSRREPLPIPEWFTAELMIFREAVEHAANGDRSGAIEILKRLRSDEMRYWFDEHGQNSGYYRLRKFNITHPAVDPGTFDPVRSPAKYERAVFERGCYTCRYCGLPLVAKHVLVAFEKAVGTEHFRTQGTNALQHGIIHGFKIVADHVVPYRRGGRTNLENLVSACPACNYGKYNYTLAQLGLDDPRDRTPVNSGWDGLTSFADGLRRNAFTEFSGDVAAS